MKRVVATCVGLASVLVGLAACGGAGDEIVDVTPPGTAANSFTYQEGIFVADPAFCATVQTFDGYLLVPFAGHETLDQEFPVGRVLFGDRAPDMAENNPQGFMRKVQSVAREGEYWRVNTVDAFLEDVFAKASLHNDGNPNYDLLERAQGTGGDLSPQDRTEGRGSLTRTAGFALGPTELAGTVGGEGGNVSGGLETSLKFSLSARETLTVSPVVKVDYEGGGWFSSPTLMFDVKVPWSLVEERCFAIEGQAKSEVGYNIASRFPGKLKNLFSVPIPIGSLGPVPVTLELEAKVACSAFASGGAMVTSTTTTTSAGQGAVFGYRGGFTVNAEQPQAPQNTTQRRVVTNGGGGVQCELPLRASIKLAGTFGGFFQVVPGLEAKVGGGRATTNGAMVASEQCLELNASLKFEYGLSVTLSERFGLGFEAKQQIGEGWKANLLPATAACGGSEACAGRADGWYCSGLDGKNSFRCAGGANAGGSACAGDTYCQTQSSTDIERKAKMAGEVPECGARPERPSMELKCQ